MTKKHEWINGNKMRFDSGFKTFDKQTTYLTTGNHLGETQLSLYVRAYNEKLNPVGKKVEPGAMQEWDLKNFTDVPEYVKEKVRELAKDKSVVLNELMYWKGEEKIPVGWVITSGYDGNYELLADYAAKNSDKYWKAIREAEKYISNEKKRLRA